MPISIPDMLPNLCGYFELGSLSSFREAGGYANRNLVVETACGIYLARILREKGPAELNSEALYLERLARTGFPCPTYLTGRDGGCLFSAEDVSIALMPYLQGEVSEQLSLSQTEHLGATLARLHLIDAGPLPARNTWWRSGYLDDALARAKRRFGERALSRLEQEIAALQDLEAAELPDAIVHGDPWPGNVLFDGQHLVALIDWEETSRGIAVLDLAYLAVHGCLSGRPFDARQFAALIASYQSVRQLSPGERKVFAQAVRRVACTNYVWLLLKAEPDSGNLEELWVSQWYWGLDLDRLALAT